MRFLLTALAIGFSYWGFAPTAVAMEDPTTARDVLARVPAPEVHGETLTRAGPSCFRCRPERRNKVRWLASFYGWLTDVSGVSWADGERSEFNVAFEDILDATDAGYIIYAEARWHPKWFAAINIRYGDLTTGGTIRDGTFLGIDASANVTQLAVDLWVGYRIWARATRFSTSDGCGGCERRCRELFAIAGFRYARSTVDVTSRIRFGPAMVQRKASTEETSTDPFVGLRYLHPLGSHWTLEVSGWGGARSTREYHTQLQALVAWRFARRWSAFLGYRAERSEDTSGSGTTKSGVRLLIHGPLIGVGFRF